MPLHIVFINKNVSGWQYGKHGTIYPFAHGNKWMNKKAKEAAIRQAVAISYHSGKPLDL
jgi:hypothetical protein